MLPSASAPSTLGDLIRQDNSSNNAYQQLANTVILVSLPIAGCTLAAGIAALAGCALLAWRAYREADDFLDAAGRVDDAVNGHQEIVTLASLADPAMPQAQRAQRTPLFPLLWRRAVDYLERFDPNRAFAFDVRRPLRRSLPIAAAMVVVLAAVALALVRPPTAEQLQARKLRAAAQQLADSPSPADKELASKILATADAMENPKLPPQEKLERLAEAMRELQKQQQQGSSPQQSARNAVSYTHLTLPTICSV